MTCICSEVDHSDFDLIVKEELKNPIYVNNIANESYCVSIDLDIDEEFIDISLDKNEILEGLKKKMGLYQLWVEQDYCGDHVDHRMLCVYTGKGYVHTRLLRDHIPKKWVKDEKLYVTFYECSNRIAKYLEQLFLDTYDFHFNKDENYGYKILHSMWEEGRVVNGTELHEQSELLSQKNPEFFNP